MSQLHSCKTEVPFLARTRFSYAAVLEPTQLPYVGRLVQLFASVLLVEGLSHRMNLVDYHNLLRTQRNSANVLNSFD